jgi:hypothetical protein
MRSQRTQSPVASRDLSPSAADPDNGRTEPVVTYSRLPPEAAESLDAEGRVEPRLAVLPVEREARRPSPRLEAVRADARSADARSMAASAPRVRVDGVPPDRMPVDDLVDTRAGMPADAGVAALPPRRRGRGARVALLVGLIALLGGAGVLAATFSGVLHGDASVARIPAVGETAGGTAAAVPVDGDVRVIGGSTGVARLSTTAPADAPPAAASAEGSAPAVAALDPAASVGGEAAPKVIDPPPLPRLRPTQGTEAAAPLPAGLTPPAVATAPAAAAVLRPPVRAPGPANLGTLTVSPRPLPGAAAGSRDADADALMDDVDRLLAQRRAAQAAAPAGAPLLAPAPSGEAAVVYSPDAYPPNAYPPANAYPAPAAYPPNAYPPAAYPPNSYPADSGLASAEPPPPPVRSRYRNILPDDEVLPTPPANVPQGGVY